MCGIVGEVRFNAGEARLCSLEEASRRQLSRGPDGSGLWQSGPIAMGHRRLRIYDLSEWAAQPMVDHALGLSLVFNGAIYNFRELRRELEAKGYVFVSESDTEVLLKAYHAWGRACIARLRGMFAFAIWERDTGRLVLARDRMGIKPLFYARTPAAFRFASTLPALLAFDDVDRAVDPDGLYFYLTLHAIPDPTTILKGIRKVPPASILVVHPDGRTEEETYWQLQLDGDRAAPADAERWVDAVDETLSAAVERQLTADVPVGVLLSGGLDSSVITALASRLKGGDIDTFSIGFEGVDGESGDEFVYSDQVARQFQSRHHKLFIPEGRMVDALADCVSAMSEPMPSHDNVGFFLLSQEVSRHVKVVLSGQGADELFAGYSWFQSFPREARGAHEAAQLIRTGMADRSYDDYQDLVLPHVRAGDLAAGYLRRLVMTNASLSPVDGLMLAESGFALANGPLARMDNMAMSAGLEARVPFLDEAVVDLATTMPLEHKLSEGGKGVLKQFGRRLLPRNVVDRVKGYFPVPALKHVKGTTLQFVRDILTPEAVARRGLVKWSRVAAMIDRPGDYVSPSGASHLWQLGLLEFWLQRQGL